MEFEIWYIWLLAAILLFMIEIFVTSFVAACIGIGALITGIGAYMGLNITLQLLVFVGFTFLILFFIRPFVKKFIFGTKEFVTTSADTLLGKKATVVEPIDGNKLQGRVKIDGDSWKAISFDGKSISKGQIVTVVSYDSLILSVK